MVWLPAETCVQPLRGGGGCGGRRCPSYYLASLFSGIRETAWRRGGGAGCQERSRSGEDAKHRGIVRTLKSQAPDWVFFNIKAKPGPKRSRDFLRSCVQGCKRARSGGAMVKAKGGPVQWPPAEPALCWGLLGPVTGVRPALPLYALVRRTLHFHKFL